MNRLLSVLLILLSACASRAVRGADPCDALYAEGRFLDARACLEMALLTDPDERAERRLAGLDREAAARLDGTEAWYFVGYDAWRRHAFREAANAWRRYRTLADYGLADSIPARLEEAGRFRKDAVARVTSAMEVAAPPPEPVAVPAPPPAPRSVPASQAKRRRPAPPKRIGPNVTARTLMERGDLAAQNGRWEKSIRFYEWAMRLEPGNAALKERIGKLRKRLR